MYSLNPGALRAPRAAPASSAKAGWKAEVERERPDEGRLGCHAIAEMRRDDAGVVGDQRVFRGVALGLGDMHARFGPAIVHCRGPGQRILGEDVVA